MTIILKIYCFCIPILMLINNQLNAQSISSQMIGVTGGMLKSETVSLAFGAGEVVVGTFEGETMSIVQGFSNNFNVIPVSLESEHTLPDRIALHQNYPNPFNPSTTIGFDLPLSANVKVVIYNIIGMKIAEMDAGLRAAGSHQLVFHASSLSSGVYFYRLFVNGANHDTKKMTLIK